MDENYVMPRMEIDKFSKLYKISWTDKDGLALSTLIMAVDSSDAEKAFRQEYGVEYPRDMKINVMRCTNGVHWYSIENTLENRPQIIVSLNCLKMKT